MKEYKNGTIVLISFVVGMMISFITMNIISGCGQWGEGSCISVDTLEIDD